jgi:DNA-binding response OmpR family regulator
MSAVPERVLLVDDDAAIREVCGLTLRQEGWDVVVAATGQEALQHCGREPFAVAVVDLVLPDLDGLSLLSAIREADPDTAVIMITGYATVEAAIAAVRQGAYDFLRKPFGVADLIRVVHRGLEQRRLAVENRDLLQELGRTNQDLRHQVDVVTEELTAFLNLGRKLSASTGPLPLAAEIMRAAQQLAGARTAGLFVLLPEGRFRCVAAEGEAAADLGGRECPGDEPLLARCQESRRPVIVPELLADPDLATGPFALAGLSAALAVPLLALSGCVGVLVLFDPLQPFTDRQASLIKVLVTQAAEVLAQNPLRGPAHPAADEFVDLSQILQSRPASSS